VFFWLLGAGELARIPLQRPWPGFPPTVSHWFGVFLAALWILTGAVLLLRRRSPFLANAAWLLDLAPPFTMFVYGIIIRSYGSWWGLLYLPAAALAAIGLSLTWGGGEFSRLSAKVRAAQTPSVTDPSGGTHHVARGDTVHGADLAR
jgi:hypothetical protein